MRFASGPLGAFLTGAVRNAGRELPLYNCRQSATRMVAYTAVSRLNRRECLPVCPIAKARRPREALREPIRNLQVDSPPLREPAPRRQVGGRFPEAIAPSGTILIRSAHLPTQ